MNTTRDPGESFRVLFRGKVFVVSLLGERNSVDHPAIELPYAVDKSPVAPPTIAIIKIPMFMMDSSLFCQFVKCLLIPSKTLHTVL